MDRTYEPSPGSLGFPKTVPRGGRGDVSLWFAGFRLDADGSLHRDETLIHIPPKELAALRLLLAKAGEIVTQLEIKQALWGDVHVTAESVPKCISALRALLEPENCIQTVYKRGYRLSAAVRLQTAPPGETLPRLAITPFSTEFGVPEYLGHAIAEETIAQLTNTTRPASFILARDSVFTLAHKGFTALQVGEKLNADLVLAGTLRALTRHFRLRVEMIRVASGVQIWVEDFLVEQARVGALESELIVRLAFRLGAGQDARHWPEGSPAEPPPAGSTPKSVPTVLENAGGTGQGGGLHESFSISASVPDPLEEAPSRQREAYETFQRGRHEWRSLERHRMQDGLQHLTRATELDPSLIAAKVELVHLCVAQPFYGYLSPTVAADLVHRTADSIPDLPRQAPALLPPLGWVNFHFDHNLSAALWAFSQSAQLPHDPWTTLVRAMFALSRHRFAEAIALLQSAIQLDPFAPWLQSRLAWALHLDGQAAASVEQMRRAISLFPEHQGTALYGASILACNGDPEGALQLAQGLANRNPQCDLASSVQAYALACAGRAGEARAILERLQWLSRERYVLTTLNPAAYVALGDLDTALAELRNSAQARCPWFFQMLADPRLKPLHGHPEFIEFQSTLTRMEAGAAHQPNP